MADSHVLWSALAFVQVKSVTVDGPAQVPGPYCMFHNLFIIQRASFVQPAETRIGRNGRGGRGSGVADGQAWPIIVGVVLLVVGVPANIYTCKLIRAEHNA